MNECMIHNPKNDSLFENKIKVLRFFKKHDDVNFLEVDCNFFPSEDVKNLIKKGWEFRFKDILDSGKEIYNSALVRFEKLENNNILFSAGIHYSDVVGLRYWRHDIYKDFDSNSKPNALSLFNILITKDNKLVLSKRDCGDWERSYEVCGGFIRAEESNFIFKSSLNRIFDDYFIKRELILSQDILAVYDYDEISETTLLFAVKLDIDSEEFSNLSYNKDVIFIDNSLESIKDFLNKNTRLILPSYYALRVFSKNLYF